MRPASVLRQSDAVEVHEAWTHSFKNRLTEDPRRTDGRAPELVADVLNPETDPDVPEPRRPDDVAKGRANLADAHVLQVELFHVRPGEVLDHGALLASCSRRIRRSASSHATSC